MLVTQIDLKKKKKPTGLNKEKDGDVWDQIEK